MGLSIAQRRESTGPQRPEEPPSPQSAAARHPSRLLPAEIAAGVARALAADCSFLLLPSDVVAAAAALEDLAAAAPGFVVSAAHAALRERRLARPLSAGTPPPPSPRAAGAAGAGGEQFEYEYPPGAHAFDGEWKKVPAPVEASAYYAQLGVRPAGGGGSGGGGGGSGALLSPEQQAAARLAARRLYGGSTRAWLLRQLRAAAAARPAPLAAPGAAAAGAAAGAAGLAGSDGGRGPAAGGPAGNSGGGAGPAAACLSPELAAALDWLADECAARLSARSGAACLRPFDAEAEADAVLIGELPGTPLRSGACAAADARTALLLPPAPPLLELLRRWLPRALRPEPVAGAAADAAAFMRRLRALCHRRAREGAAAPLPDAELLAGAVLQHHRAAAAAAASGRGWAGAPGDAAWGEAPLAAPWGCAEAGRAYARRQRRRRRALEAELRADRARAAQELAAAGVREPLAPRGADWGFVSPAGAAQHAGVLVALALALRERGEPRPQQQRQQPPPAGLLTGGGDGGGSGGGGGGSGGFGDQEASLLRADLEEVAFDDSPPGSEGEEDEWTAGA
ncbi:hypothetical protein Rsub_09948 [Raphidocelis subcapitata]|uniref:Uncharacterized protein n=1 Tax=Raphidocelis subcapitata TaxID=307507 RepID=A0A2V0PIW6_9CHLO|nr:hypothetical protein Rsub_09948 [Raphidocelis subcapitata]|eukprot:GBF97257.1 hypothetical protein Rsub_09948 [Raphidocelis subcapitata]